MTMFIGRERELNTLKRMYASENFQMLILYGRRRIGKTTLLNEFSKDKNPIFYTGVESKDDENLKELGRTVFSYFSGSEAGMIFASYSDIFDYMTAEIGKKKGAGKQLIILDEYPYIAAGAKEVSSMLQRVIDHDWSRMNIMLVLCGSSIPFMEEEVLGAESPLYGRRTGQMDLKPFDYLTSARFVPEYPPEDQAIVYGVTGGVPKYLSMFDPQKSLDENLRQQYFDPAGYFYEEPQNMLRQEFRDISLYFAILNAIGSGSCLVHEISSKTGFNSEKVVQALQKLEVVRIIRKDIPILNEKNRKLSQYVIQDGMFRFWFRFLPKGLNTIERGFGKEYYENAVRPFLHEYMGPVFERICQDYTAVCGMTNGSGFIINRVGKWRGSDPVRKEQTDIDVVGISDAEKKAVIGECKFKNEPVGRQEYETLHDRARLISPYHVEQFLLFSLNGFTKWVMAQAAEDSSLELVSMTDLYRQTNNCSVKE